MPMAAVSKKGIEPEKLPLIEKPIKYDSFRVHLQVLQWMGAGNTGETEWK